MPLLPLVLLLLLASDDASLFRHQQVDTRSVAQHPPIVDTVACGLEVPWALACDGDDLYLTERPGRLRLIRGGHGNPVLLGTIPGVHAGGEGGLMGLALHPGFRENRLFFVSYTTRTKGGSVVNRVSRFRLSATGPVEELVILDDLPGSPVHNGCRLKFGPDGMLYVSTGDAARRQDVQDRTRLGGKILRLTSEGGIPGDNPWAGSPVFATGLRNPQGMAWGDGTFFVSDHGPSGFDGPGGGDEVNLVTPGANMGWPIIHHREEREGMVSPLFEFTPAIAPSGIIVGRNCPREGWRGSIFVASLRGRKLLRLDPVNRTEEVIISQFGRLRDVVEGPDGSLYVATSNRDGRGSPASCDDTILRIR
jgi:glucose/arabinose dehydrogenase